MGKGMRTAVYIDGFNLYYGAVRKTSYKWLDLHRLCELVLPKSCQLTEIKYFTATVKSDDPEPNAHSRQKAYLKALTAHIPSLTIIQGHFLMVTAKGKPTDPALAAKYPVVEIVKPEEKGSDVNLAVQLLHDAWENRYDCAVVLSNDSDLAEAMRLARKDCGKTIGLMTPWRRRASKRLMQHSDFQRTIRKAAVARAQLPSPVPGTKIHKPPGW